MRLLTTPLCLLLCIGLQPARAADPTDAAPARSQPKWELGAGLGVFSLPDYRGSDHQSTATLPFPYVIYRGEIIKADRSGVRGMLFDSERMELELSLNGGVPVKSKDNAVRQGMPDLDPSLEIGPQAIVHLLGKTTDETRLDLRLPLRQVITSGGEGKGLTFTPALNLSITPPAGWHIGAQVGLYAGTRQYHRFLYAVDSQYATANRPAYSAQSGYGGWQMTTSLSRRFDKLWLGGFVRLSSVKGAVFDNSPLVARKTNVSAGIGIAWVFAQSDERVISNDDD